MDTNLDVTPIQQTPESISSDEHAVKFDTFSSDLLSLLYANLPSNSTHPSELIMPTTSTGSASPRRPTLAEASLVPRSASNSPLSDRLPISSPSSSSKEVPSTLESSSRSGSKASAAVQIPETDVLPDIVQAISAKPKETGIVNATVSAQPTPPLSPSPLSGLPRSTSSCSSLLNISTQGTQLPPRSSDTMTFASFSHPSPSSLNLNPNPTRLLFPRVLAKPPYNLIQSDVISGLDADLESVPLPYIISMLKQLGPRMMAVLARTSATIPIPTLSEPANTRNEQGDKSARTVLPRELLVTVLPEAEKDQRTSWSHAQDVKNFDTQPTHLLAVYSRPFKTSDSNNNQRRKVTLFPTHGIILAAHCANLPALPPGRKTTLTSSTLKESGRWRNKKGRDMKRHFGVDVPDSIPESESEFSGIDGENNDGSIPDRHDGDGALKMDSTLNLSPGWSKNVVSAGVGMQVTLPVVPLCIPSPGTFPILQAYLYTKRADRLLAALVPAVPSLSRSAEITGISREDIAESLGSAFVSSSADLSRQLSATFSPHVLLTATLRTHELWANVTALGVFDESLWKVINYAWEVLLGALEVVQMKMKNTAVSASSQNHWVGLESHHTIAVHIRARQEALGHVPGESSIALSASQSGLISPASPSSPSHACLRIPLKEGQGTVDAKQG